MEKGTAALKDCFGCPCLNVGIVVDASGGAASGSKGREGMLLEDCIIAPGIESRIKISQPLLTSRLVSNADSQPATTALHCLNCNTAVYSVQKPLLKPQSLARTTVGFLHSTLAASQSPLAAKSAQSASDSPSPARKVAPIPPPEEEVLCPDPTTGTLRILKGCLQGSETLAKAAASDAYSAIFGLQVLKDRRDEEYSLEGINLEEETPDTSREIASSIVLKRAKSPRRPLPVKADDSSSMSPSPARIRSKALAYRTEEEEGDDLDTLHLLENLLPPLPSSLVLDQPPHSTNQPSATPLSPRRMTSNPSSSSYFPLSSASSSQKRLESQLETSGLAELRSQRETARGEIYELLKEKRKVLSRLEQRIRQDARRLVGQRSRSSSKEGGQRIARLDVDDEVSVDRSRREGESNDAIDRGSPLFERKRPLFAPNMEMTRSSSSQSTQADSTMTVNTAASGLGGVAMPGRAGSSFTTTGSNTKTGSYLSASFAMRGRDLPQVPASPSLELKTLESKEDEEEWYAQKRRLRERYPHADHSELPSAVNSDDEGNVEVKKDAQSDEDEEGRGRGRGRQSSRLGPTTNAPKGKQVEQKSASIITEQHAKPSLQLSVESRKSSDDDVSKGLLVKKGAMKANTPTKIDQQSKDGLSSTSEKKVAFAEVPSTSTIQPVKEVPPAKIVDEGADAVFEIDEEIEGEGTPRSSHISLDTRASALMNEKDALQVAETEEELSRAQEADMGSVEDIADVRSGLSKGSIAQSLPMVGSFAAMASSEMGRKSIKEGSYEVEALDEEMKDGQFDPASLRLEDVPLSTRSSNIINLDDTSVFGSRPRPSRITSSDLGPDALLSGFPQSSKEHSSTIGFRVAVGEAEAQLSGLLAPHAPSHRNLWASPDKRKLTIHSQETSKYSLQESVSEKADGQDNEQDEVPAWQQRLREVNPQSSTGLEAFARSVPIGIANSPNNRRMSMTTATTTFKDGTSGFDLEPKTSLPYREKKFTPSLRKATRQLTTSTSIRGTQSSLATISDSSEAGGSTTEASLLSVPSSQRMAEVLSQAQQGEVKKPSSIPSSVTRGFFQSVPLPSSTQSTPGLGSSGSQFENFVKARGSRRSIIQSPYTPPPPPSTSELRLEPNEKNRPREIKLGEVAVDMGFSKLVLDESTGDDDEDLEKDLKFMHTLEALKTNKRTGWFHHRIVQPESIADHMYRMAILSMLLPRDNLDIGKCVQLCLIHDIAEALVGDLTPLDGISKEEKLKREKEALLHLVHDLLGSSPAALRMEQLWMEYEDRETLESKAVKDLDRFELCLQAVEYERRYTITDLQPFFEGSLGFLTHPQIRKWAEQLAKEREQLWEKTPYKYQQSLEQKV